MAKTRAAKKLKGHLNSTSLYNQQNLINNNVTVIIPNSRKRQQKTRVKRVSWRDEQLQSMNVGEIDPAILFVRQSVKIKYSREQLFEIGKNPASKSKPEFLDPNEVCISVLDPEKWNLERKKSDTPETGTKSVESSDTRRRPGDPRERIRKENDGIVLSPQRRSFNSGCFVPANKEPLGGKNEPPHVMGAFPGVREISSNTRRIGSGRIVRDSWDNDKDSGENDFGFGRGQSRNNDRDDKFGDRERSIRDEKFGERRSFGRELDTRDKEKETRRNTRYSESRRRYSDSNEEPEWYSSGPISQNDTIELRGFDEPEKLGKKKLAPSRVKRAKDWSKKKESQSIAEEKDRDNEEREPKGRSTPNPQEPQSTKEENVEEPNKGAVSSEEGPEKEPDRKQSKQQQQSSQNEHMFNFEEFLKFESIPGLLTNGVGGDGDKATSRFSRWFKKESPNKELMESSRRSSIQEDNHIIKDLLKDINESSSIPVTIHPPSDSNTYFAPISPAANTNSALSGLMAGKPPQQQPQQPPNIGQQINIMDMLVRGKQPAQQGGPDGWNIKPQAPAGGKILSLDELEAKIRQKPDHPANIPQKAPQKPDEETTAAFKRLLQQAGGHTVPQNGPMNKPQAMSLLEMLNHSQQQDEARLAAAQAAATQQQHQLLSALHSHQQPQPQIHNDLTLKLQQAQLQKQQMDMFGKLMSGAVPGAGQMRASPLLDMGAQQSRELLSRPEAQAILQAMHQRIPSPRELQVHTQNILQRALIKKKLEEQTENFRKKQEMQRGNSPNPAVSGANQMPQQMGGSKGISSPTPLAFTPTSVLRKMTAEKDEGKENKAVTDNGVKPQGRPLTGMRQQPQVTVSNPQWNQSFPVKQAGRPIVKANTSYQSQTPDQFFAQLAQQQQPQPQQRIYQTVPNTQQRKPIVGQQYPPQGSQYGSAQPQYPHPNPQSFSQPTPQQLRAQHQHRPTNTPQTTQPGQQPPSQQQNQQGPPKQAQQPPMGFPQGQPPQGQQQGNAAWQQFLNTAVQQQNSRPSTTQSLTGQQTGSLSPSTANQLTRWFSPDLLERARGGELPSTANLARHALSLEDIERQAAPTVHN